MWKTKKYQRKKKKILSNCLTNHDFLTQLRKISLSTKLYLFEVFFVLRYYFTNDKYISKVSIKGS